MRSPETRLVKNRVLDWMPRNPVGKKPGFGLDAQKPGW
jgi:hypothetical protein